jgi:hypothetical protein
MGRSIETLILGYASVAPILGLPQHDHDEGDAAGGHTDDDTAYHNLWGGTRRRRSTVSTLGSTRSSMGTGGPAYHHNHHHHHHGRRGSLVGATTTTRRIMHGGTTANFYNHRRPESGGGYTHRRNSTNSSNGSVTGTFRRGSQAGMTSRRGSASHGGPSYHTHHHHHHHHQQQRRLNGSRSNSGDLDNVESGHGGGARSERERAGNGGGPNIVLSLLAREATGKLTTINPIPPSHRLKSLGGYTLFNQLDRPAAGMCSEVIFLSEVIDSGDWVETQTVISRISPRLVGTTDPTMGMMYPGMDRRPAAAAVQDPNLPPQASRFYAGGGRAGLERDALVLAGGVEVLIRVFREKNFVGAEMAETYDARDLSEELVSSRLAPCWNETLSCLRELVYSIPSLVEDGIILDHGDFLPFLFTLLSHDACFDSASALIEEILSIQSHSPTVQIREQDDMNEESRLTSGPKVRVAPPTTFFLGNVPELYQLWNGFNCRQLAHFCRILALLVFEPEDRQLLVRLVLHGPIHRSPLGWLLHTILLSNLLPSLFVCVFTGESCGAQIY